MDSLLSRLEFERLDRPGATDAACVEAIAAELVRELAFAGPPINLRMVASLLGVVKVQEVAGLEAAGCLIPQEEGAVIHLRSDDPPVRRRFTLGHECSHTLMPGFSTATQFRCSPTIRPPLRGLDVEALCDLGASRLLLPEAFFRPAAQSARFGWDAVQALAATFEASLIATAIRYVQDWPEPAAVIVLEERQKPSEAGTAAPPQLRVQWSSASGQWPFFIKHKSVEVGDIFDRANNGEIVMERTAHITGICKTGVMVEAHVRVAPYLSGMRQQRRVIALLRRPSEWLRA